MLLTTYSESQSTLAHKVVNSIQTDGLVKTRVTGAFILVHLTAGSYIWERINKTIIIDLCIPISKDGDMVVTSTCHL